MALGHEEDRQADGATTLKNGATVHCLKQFDSPQTDRCGKEPSMLSPDPTAHMAYEHEKE